MSDISAGRFTCNGCGKSFEWKPQLAGKRAKCKCGAILNVPASIAPKAPKSEPELDDLYDLAPAAGGGGGAGAEHRSSLPDDEEAPPPLPPLTTPALADTAPRVPTARAGGGSTRGGKAVLGYSGRRAAAQQDRFSSANLIDPTRDLYAPLAIFLAGFALYVGYYTFKYDLGGTGIAMTTLGLGIITTFKAVLLIVAAMVLAGPLGVSFGDVRTAPLKLAAIAVFSDGVTTWIDAAMEAGGAGGMSGVVSFPISLGVYWALLIYLFNMDAGDSWLVVMLLAVFDYLVRWLLLMLLLSSVLGWGGIAGALPGGGGGSGSADAEARAHFQDLLDGGYLHEARKYAADGKSVVMMDQVNAWYAAGARTVWFETGRRDINGRANLDGIRVELPDDPEQRAACYKILNDFHRGRDPNAAADEDFVEDDGEPYLVVPMMNR